MHKLEPKYNPTYLCSVSKIHYHAFDRSSVNNASQEEK